MRKPHLMSSQALSFDEAIHPTAAKKSAFLNLVLNSKNSSCESGVPNAVRQTSEREIEDAKRK